MQSTLAAFARWVSSSDQVRPLEITATFTPWLRRRATSTSQSVARWARRQPAKRADTRGGEIVDDREGLFRGQLIWPRLARARTQWPQRILHARVISQCSARARTELAEEIEHESCGTNPCRRASTAKLSTGETSTAGEWRRRYPREAEGP